MPDYIEPPCEKLQGINKNVLWKERKDIMLEKIQELVAEGLGVDAEKVVPEASFKDDLGADSLV